MNNIIPIVVDNTPMCMCKYIYKALCLKGYNQKQPCTHRYTFPQRPSFWLLSLHEVGVELPVESSREPGSI